MKQFFKFVGASLKMTYREKIALFWMFLFPLLLMLMLGTIFGHSNQANITLGVVDRDNSQMTKTITDRLAKISAFKLSKGSESDLKQKLVDGKLNAILILNQGFQASIFQHKPGEATIYVDRSSPTVSQITSTALNQVMGEIGVGMAKQVMPNVIGPGDIIKVTEKSLTSTDMRYVDFIVPGILAMTLMTSGLLGLSLSMVQNREKGILRRVKVSPLPLSRFLGSEISAALVMSLIQAAVLLLVGWAVFRIHINGNWLYIWFLIILGAAAFLAMGFLIASVTKTLKTAEMASNAITFPMMFLSGVFFPLAILPGFLAVIAKCLPLYYLGDALRKVMIQGKSLSNVWLDVLVVAGMGIICFIAAIKLFRWE
jgi:ABC-2 type transport system permease protein